MYRPPHQFTRNEHKAIVASGMALWTIVAVYYPDQPTMGILTNFTISMFWLLMEPAQ